MLRATVALAFMLAGHRVQAEDAGKVYQECTDVLKSNMAMTNCCTLFYHDEHHEKEEERKMCNSPSPGEELKCEDSECMLQGFFSGDKIDYQKLAELHDMSSKMNPEHKELWDRVKETCSEKNMKHLSTTDCPAYDYQACMSYTVLQYCPELNKEDKECAAMIERSKTCGTAMEKLVSKN